MTKNPESFELTDPLPYFANGDRVLYIGSENAYLFAIPRTALEAHRRNFGPKALDREDKDEAHRLSARTVLKMEDLDDDEVTAMEQVDVADLDAARGGNHGFGTVTSCWHLANRAPRALLAAAEILDDPTLNASLSAWANFCDFVSDEVSNSVPLEEALVTKPTPSERAWATSATDTED